MVDRSAGRASWTLDPYQVSVSYAARGAGWFGPLAPTPPAAPPEVAGRQWDYPSGFNLALGPRANEPVGFATLRRLADGWDLLRLVIETRKDQIGRMAWSIGRRPGTTPDLATAADATAFFRRPDGIHGWADWLRMLLEELFVVDAPALYCRRDRAGRRLGRIARVGELAAGRLRQGVERVGNGGNDGVGRDRAVVAGVGSFVVGRHRDGVIDEHAGVALLRAPANSRQAERADGGDLRRRGDAEIAERERVRHPAAVEVNEHADAERLDVDHIGVRCCFHAGPRKLQASAGSVLSAASPRP